MWPFVSYLVYVVRHDCGMQSFKLPSFGASASLQKSIKCKLVTFHLAFQNQICICNIESFIMRIIFTDGFFNQGISIAFHITTATYARLRAFLRGLKLYGAIPAIRPKPTCWVQILSIVAKHDIATRDEPTTDTKNRSRISTCMDNMICVVHDRR